MEYLPSVDVGLENLKLKSIHDFAKREVQKKRKQRRNRQQERRKDRRNGGRGDGKDDDNDESQLSDNDFDEMFEDLFDMDEIIYDTDNEQNYGLKYSETQDYNDMLGDKLYNYYSNDYDYQYHDDEDSDFGIAYSEGL